MYHKWSDAETKKLVSMARKYNEDWDAIQKLFFPGFTTLQLKNKYAATLRTSQIIRKTKSGTFSSYCRNYSTESERQVRRDTSIIHPARHRNCSLDSETIISQCLTSTSNFSAAEEVRGANDQGKAATTPKDVGLDENFMDVLKQLIDQFL